MKERIETFNKKIDYAQEIQSNLRALLTEVSRWTLPAHQPKNSHTRLQHTEWKSSSSCSSLSKSSLYVVND